MRTIDNPVAIVTGAAQGLGKAIAKRLADEGCKVSITDKNSEVVVAGEEIGAESYVGNVGEARHVRQVVDSVLKIYGKIDILINNQSQNESLAQLCMVMAGASMGFLLLNKY